MGKALYRQFRPSSFDEVIGQDHITTTLKNSLANGSFGHAYLLTGPRGVGKTSIARILAHAVNDLPYSHDGNHLDIIEIDAASNRRIDEIRSLRERVQIAPTSAKYKVYIIDEVHMLTKEAFNALLKTLEEPPEHVIFILATTDVHKLPDTIISRCIAFTLKPISDTNLIAHMRHIADSEKVKISDEALELLAIHGDGSFRDSISLLDQVKHSNTTIEVSDIELALGLAPKSTVDSILQAVVSGNPQDLHEALNKVYEHGATEANICKQIAEAVRQQIVSKSLVISSTAALTLLEELLDVPGSPKPRAKLELCLLTPLFDIAPATVTKPQLQVAVAAPVAVTPTVTVTEVPKPTPEPVVAVPKPKEELAEINLDPPVPTPTVATGEPADEIWDSVLQKLKIKNNTLYGIARMADASVNDSTLSLTFKFPFHYKQVNQARNKSILSAVIKDAGHTYELDIQLNDARTQAPKVSTEDPLKSINNIFGDSEVLES